MVRERVRYQTTAHHYCRPSLVIIGGGAEKTAGGEEHYVQKGGVGGRAGGPKGWVAMGERLWPLPISCSGCTENDRHGFLRTLLQSPGPMHRRKCPQILACPAETTLAPQAFYALVRGVENPQGLAVRIPPYERGVQRRAFARGVFEPNKPQGERAGV